MHVSWAGKTDIKEAGDMGKEGKELIDPRLSKVIVKGVSYTISGMLSTWELQVTGFKCGASVELDTSFLQ